MTWINLLPREQDCRLVDQLVARKALGSRLMASASTAPAEIKVSLGFKVPGNIFFIGKERIIFINLGGVIKRIVVINRSQNCEYTNPWDFCYEFLPGMREGIYERAARNYFVARSAIDYCHRNVLNFVDSHSYTLLTFKWISFSK
jgi:hypothetical protein